MDQIPETTSVIVLRTDFTDDAAWEAVCAELRQPAPISEQWAAINAVVGQTTGPIAANVECISDPRFRDRSLDQILAAVPQASDHTFLFVVDAETISNPEHPVLVVDLLDEPGRTFRAVPREIQSIENNFSLANMDWEDFADAVDDDGVFRGLSW